MRRTIYAQVRVSAAVLLPWIPLLLRPVIVLWFVSRGSTLEQTGSALAICESVFAGIAQARAPRRTAPELRAPRDEQSG